jgi:hypothetical protein
LGSFGIVAWGRAKPPPIAVVILASLACKPSNEEEERSLFINPLLTMECTII